MKLAARICLLAVSPAAAAVTEAGLQRHGFLRRHRERGSQEAGLLNAAVLKLAEAKASLLSEKDTEDLMKLVLTVLHKVHPDGLAPVLAIFSEAIKTEVDFAQRQRVESNAILAARGAAPELHGAALRLVAAGLPVDGSVDAKVELLKLARQEEAVGKSAAKNAHGYRVVMKMFKALDIPADMKTQFLIRLERGEQGQLEIERISRAASVKDFNLSKEKKAEKKADEKAHKSSPHAARSGSIPQVANLHATADKPVEAAHEPNVKDPLAAKHGGIPEVANLHTTADKPTEAAQEPKAEGHLDPVVGRLEEIVEAAIKAQADSRGEGEMSKEEKASAAAAVAVDGALPMPSSPRAAAVVKAEADTVVVVEVEETAPSKVPPSPAAEKVDDEEVEETAPSQVPAAPAAEKADVAEAAASHDAGDMKDEKLMELALTVLGKGFPDEVAPVRAIFREAVKTEVDFAQRQRAESSAILAARVAAPELHGAALRLAAAGLPVDGSVDAKVELLKLARQEEAVGKSAAKNAHGYRVVVNMFKALDIPADMKMQFLILLERGEQGQLEIERISKEAAEKDFNLSKEKKAEKKADEKAHKSSPLAAKSGSIPEVPNLHATADKPVDAAHEPNVKGPLAAKHGGIPEVANLHTTADKPTEAAQEPKIERHPDPMVEALEHMIEAEVKATAVSDAGTDAVKAEADTVVDEEVDETAPSKVPPAPAAEKVDVAEAAAGNDAGDAEEEQEVLPAPDAQEEQGVQKAEVGDASERLDERERIYLQSKHIKREVARTRSALDKLLRGTPIAAEVGGLLSEAQAEVGKAAEATKSEVLMAARALHDVDPAAANRHARHLRAGAPKA